MSKKNILLVISTLLIIIGVAIIMIVAVTSGMKNDVHTQYGSGIETEEYTEPPLNSELAFLTEHDWIRNENCLEHISFHRDGTFSYWCSCGSGVDNYDLYDRYEYKDSVISIKGFDGDTSMKIIYYDRYYLCLYLEAEQECRVFTDSEYADNPHIEHDPAAHAGKGWANLHILGCDGESVTLAPFNYDRDAHLEFDEYIRKASLSDNVEYYSVTTTDDNGKVTTEHCQLDAAEIEHIGEYYTSGYVNFDTEGNIKYIVFYGKTTIVG